MSARVPGLYFLRPGVPPPGDFLLFGDLVGSDLRAIFWPAGLRLMGVEVGRVRPPRATMAFMDFPFSGLRGPVDFLATCFGAFLGELLEGPAAEPGVLWLLPLLFCWRILNFSARLSSKVECVKNPEL